MTNNFDFTDDDLNDFPTCIFCPCALRQADIEAGYLSCEECRKKQKDEEE